MNEKDTLETQDTLRRFGDILKLYSEQFELIFENENIFEQWIDGVTFMEDYYLRIKQVAEELLNRKV